MRISRINARHTNFWRSFACALLLIIVTVSLAANWLAPGGYAKQYREAADAGPTRQHWLGTDEIGRDRFARVLYGTRISLLLAPAAALLSTLMAALVGGFGGYLGGRWARGAMAVTDLFLSLPAVFTDYGSGADAVERLAAGFGAGDVSDVRALGWTSAARVLCSTAGSLRESIGASARALQARRRAPVLDSRGTEFEAGAICAILDFDSCFHPERGQFGDFGIRRGGADAFMGKPVEGIGGAGIGGRRTVEVCAADFAGDRSDVSQLVLKQDEVAA